MSGPPTVPMSGSASRPTPAAVPDHELLRVIGRGSYGEVWEARNLMGTPRAVKIVRRSDFESARPFDREFEGIQRYEPISRTHAGLVQVLHVGRSAGGDSFYYVMELADRAGPAGGEDDSLPYAPRTLRGELERRGCLGVAECVELGLALAAALGHLHAAGLVHRDVKPANIVYVDGVPKLADAGLVARSSDARSFVGTEGYLSPEGSGRPGSDIYSLGKVLYECVTGLDRLSFPDVPDNWCGGPASRAAFEFMDIVLRAAEDDPARRYGGTEELVADLALLKAGKSLRHFRRVEVRLRRAGQVLAIGAIALAVAGGAWSYERFRRDQVEDAREEALTARDETRRLLGESLVAQARAVRSSRLAGAREDALGAVRRGLGVGSGLFDLRTEAASALALIGSGPVVDAAGIAATGGLARWSPDGGHWVLLERDERVRVVERSSGGTVASLPVGPGVVELLVSSGARMLAVVRGDGTAVVREVGTGRVVWETRLAAGAGPPAFAPDGTWVVASTEAGLEACATGVPEIAGGVLLVAGAPPARSLLVAPDNRWIAALPVGDGTPEKAGRRDPGARVYLGLPGGVPGSGAAASIVVHELDSDMRLSGGSISPDSRYLAAAVGEDRLRIWEVPSMAQVAWLRGHQRMVRGTAFLPGNPEIVASTSWDGTTRLWDIPTRREILVLPVGGEEVALLPERGELLLRTWDRGAVRSAPLSRQCALRVLMLPPRTPFGLLTGVDFSPDGRLLAAAGDAGVIVWDLDTGAPHVVEPSPGPQRWRDVVFVRHADALLYSGHDGLIRRPIERGADGGLVFPEARTVVTGFCGDLQWVGERRIAVSGRRSRGGQPAVLVLDPNGTFEELEASHLPDQLAASPDGRWLAATRYPEGGGTLWDLAVRPPSSRPLASARRCVYGFNAESSVLVSGSDREVDFLAPDGSAAGCPAVAPSLRRKDSEFTPARSSSSQAAGLVAVATGPTEITLCASGTLEPLLALDSPLTPFDCNLTFSTDGTKLALAGGVSRVVVWDLAFIRSELRAMGLGW